MKLLLFITACFSEGFSKNLFSSATTAISSATIICKVIVLYGSNVAYSEPSPKGFKLLPILQKAPSTRHFCSFAYVVSPISCQLFLML